MTQSNFKDLCASSLSFGGKKGETGKFGNILSCFSAKSKEIPGFLTETEILFSD